MDFSKEAIREERERLSFNHPGFNYPLMHRWIRKSDTLEMARVIRRSAHHLKGFINWAQYAPRWDFKQIQRFVNDHVNPKPPRMHLVFLLGKQIVGMGSLAPMGRPDEIQISLWVAEGFQGHGIGARIARTMEMYAFEVWGYSKLYYQGSFLHFYGLTIILYICWFMADDHLKQYFQIFLTDTLENV